MRYLEVRFALPSFPFPTASKRDMHEGSSSFRLSLLVSIIAAVGVLIAGCTNDPSKNALLTAKGPQRAVLILLDAARPDRFSCYGCERLTTPNIDRLADNGWVFENHFTQGTCTRTAMPTLLYSRYFMVPIFPNTHAVPLSEPANLFRRPDDECISLPRVLSGAGFKTAAISAHIWFKENTRFAREFDELHDLSVLLNTGTIYPDAEQVVDHAISWIDSSSSDRFFLYLHIMDTHFPHSFSKDARTFLPSEDPTASAFDRWGRPKDMNRVLKDAEREYLDALYDGSLRYADRQIGRLSDALEERGMLESTLIGITADHGEHLLEIPGRFEHGGPWFDTVGRIPLIFHCPCRLEPKRIDALTEGVDVMPTALSILGVPMPAGTRADGKDLLETVNHRGSSSGEYAFIDHGVRNARYKCLFKDWRNVLRFREPVLTDSIQGMIFDMEVDPYEQHNIWSDHPDMIKEFVTVYRGCLTSFYERYCEATTQEQPTAPFAIGARHLKTRPDARRVSFPLDRQNYRDLANNKGWILSTHWSKFWLLAKGTSEPISIEVAIPDGLYHVTAHIAGSATFKIATEDELTVTGEPFEPAWDVNCREASIGEVTIEDKTFLTTIIPHAENGCFFLKYLGFSPMSEGERKAGISDIELNRLRALGYVE